MDNLQAYGLTEEELRCGLETMKFDLGVLEDTVSLGRRAFSQSHDMGLNFKKPTAKSLKSDVDRLVMDAVENDSTTVMEIGMDNARTVCELALVSAGGSWFRTNDLVAYVKSVEVPHMAISRRYGHRTRAVNSLARQIECAKGILGGLPESAVAVSQGITVKAVARYMEKGFSEYRDSFFASMEIEKGLVGDLVKGLNQAAN